MFRGGFICCLAVVTLFVVAKSEEDCKIPSPGYFNTALQCCKMPTNIDEVIEDCGGKGQPPTCEIVECAFQKMKFIKDGKLDYAVMAASLDEEADKAPEFKEAIQKIKATCHKDLSDVAPAVPCEPLRAYLCTDHILLAECPENLWTKSDTCDKTKEYLDRCPELFSQS